MNKGQKMPENIRQRLLGNKRGSGNKGRKFKPITLEKMRLAKIGKTSNAKGLKHSLVTREIMRRKKLEFHAKNNPSFVPFSYDDRKKIRRERIKLYGGCHSNGEWITLKAQYNYVCVSCKRQEPDIKLTRDHIIPISRGGSDNIENIQPLCKSCNTLKGTRTIRY